MTDERIMSIVAENGEFWVSRRWRDEKLFHQCERLRRAGKLSGGKWSRTLRRYVFRAKEGKS